MSDTERANAELIAADLRPYLSVIEFIGAILGEETEVVLHDIRQLETSIVGIVNGGLTGRSVGGSATDLVLSIMGARRFADQDYLVNYESKSVDGRTFRSHTYFIRDVHDKLVGLICVNTDVRKLLQAREVLNQLLRVEPVEGQAVGERIAGSSTETADDLIRRRIVENGLDPALMSAADKERIVARLDDDGLFFLKGAVAPLAIALQVSESTVYRYIKNARSRRVGTTIRREAPETSNSYVRRIE